MSANPRRLATYADLARLPEGTRAEVIGGEVQLFDSPLPRHGRVQSGLLGSIGGPFDFDGAPGGWWILPTVDVELGVHDIVSPDVAGWRRERVPKFPASRPIAIVPDWICEIVSPSNERHDTIRKADLYFRCRVPFYWLVRPDERTLQAWRHSELGWIVAGTWTDGDKVGIPPFEAVPLDVGRLFPPVESVS